jgi:hypothetical protein
MTLRQQRSLFARLLPRLLDYIHDQGFECTLGETIRSPSQAQANVASGKGIANSLHLVGLAIDINLFDVNGKYLVNTSDHKFAGEYWKSLHPLARWGGDFKPKADGNHYSLEWQGRK